MLEKEGGKVSEGKQKVKGLKSNIKGKFRKGTNDKRK